MNQEVAKIETELSRLIQILRWHHTDGKPIEQDVATHALMLVNNGWRAEEALKESRQTLDEAEQEGQY
jgi:PhoPQ-activated pathogenicity-related protein